MISQYINIAEWGYDNDLEYWAESSGLATGSATDHMDKALGDLGYVGTPRDKFNAWAADKGGSVGTTYDNLLAATPLIKDGVGGGSDIATGLISHYKMNDNAANTTVTDATGSYNGVADANTSTMTATGRINQGFTTTTSAFDVADNVDMRLTGNYTMACWFNFTSTWSGADSQRLFFKGNGTNGYIYIFDAGSSKLAFDAYDGGVSDPIFSNATSFTGGQWYHTAVTWDGTTKIMYVDGVAQTDTSTTGSVGSDTTQTNIGRSTSGGNFKGIMDDARFYSRALAPADISALYNGGSGTED